MRCPYLQIGGSYISCDNPWRPTQRYMGIFYRGFSASSAVLLRKYIHERQVLSGNPNDDKVQLFQDSTGFV